MKKILTFPLALSIMMSLASVSFAVTTTGPSQTVTGSNKSKASTTAEPSMYIASVSIGGAGYYIFWIKHNKTSSQITPTYYFSTSGSKTIYYMYESREANEVVQGDYYSSRYKSNSTVPTGQSASIIEASFYP